MTDYVVSARKYRPENFESLVGQDNIARTLKNSILRGQLAHAYLFCGNVSLAFLFQKGAHIVSMSLTRHPIMVWMTSRLLWSR